MASSLTLLAYFFSRGHLYLDVKPTHSLFSSSVW